MYVRISPQYRFLFCRHLDLNGEASQVQGVPKIHHCLVSSYSMDCLLLQRIVLEKRTYLVNALQTVKLFFFKRVFGNRVLVTLVILDYAVTVLTHHGGLLSSRKQLHFGYLYHLVDNVNFYCLL